MCTYVGHVCAKFCVRTTIFENNFMFEAMRVSILLFQAALDSLGTARLQSVTWVTAVSALTKIIRNITLDPQLQLFLFMGMSTKMFVHSLNFNNTSNYDMNS